MYYPYLRGKQFDLLALQTLIKANRWSAKIKPIIEPVRDSATLKKTVELFDQQHLALFLITNPQVGTFKLFETLRHPWQLHHDTVKNATIVAKDLSQMDAKLYIFNEHSPRNLDQLALLPAAAPIVVLDQGRFRVLPAQKKILLQENFKVRHHVTDYAIKSDDFYSNEYLYLKTDGFFGFSDYSIEGAKYFDKGGPSRAIALHITYVDAYFNLRVKHFVSDSNDSAKDQADKFFEALTKLEMWYLRNQDQLLLTLGLQELLHYQTTQKFPGLGTIKKWSLAHHLELVGSLLEHEDHYLKGWRIDE